jgi:predicted RNA polymerase sigma factor
VVSVSDELAARLTEVLTVIYLLFNEGYLADPLGEYHLYHASRAELLRALGHPARPAPRIAVPSN